MSYRFAMMSAAVVACITFMSVPAFAQDVDFGDDSGQWIRDGECDDPRFEGPGMASVLDAVNTLADASDCRKAFQQGRIMLIPADAPGQEPANSGPTTAGDIDFGTDSSPWTYDGECDDPRFEGEGMSAAPVESDMLADASDCRAAYEAGTIALSGEVPVAAPVNGSDADTAGTVDFGDDTAVWANDGECDDPRFVGEGMSAAPVAADAGHDASDCKAAHDAGTVALAGDAPFATPENGNETNAADAIDFGDDTAVWANDGECDDPRFQGEGMSPAPVAEDIGHDATDCRTLLGAGMISVIGGTPMVPPADDTQMAGNVDFGADTGEWILDGECDDPRFSGQGMADFLVDDDIRADATDCKNLYDAGQITFNGNMGAPLGNDATKTPAGNVDFGADTGMWTNDGECDDPRFTGDGMAKVLQDVDVMADATDCRALFEAGRITLSGE
ncbi:MAG: hypothetical protein NTX73_12745 [Rhodobacterales bacterium]|nr:hypothetical protein [Rhodobacterales bacterium]